MTVNWGAAACSLPPSAERLQLHPVQEFSLEGAEPGRLLVLKVQTLVPDGAEPVNGVRTLWSPALSSLRSATPASATPLMSQDIQEQPWECNGCSLDPAVPAAIPSLSSSHAAVSTARAAAAHLPGDHGQHHPRVSGLEAPWGKGL